MKWRFNNYYCNSKVQFVDIFEITTWSLKTLLSPNHKSSKPESPDLFPSITLSLFPLSISLWVVYVTKQLLNDLNYSQHTLKNILLKFAMSTSWPTGAQLISRLTAGPLGWYCKFSQNISPMYAEKSFNKICIIWRDYWTWQLK